jgi:cell shape-determining protein MreC
MPDSIEERLRAENENLRQAIANTWRPEVAALRAEIERLKAYERMWHEQYASDLVQARAENERLRAEIDELKRALALVSKAGRADNEDNERLRQLFGTISELLETFNPDP